MVFGMLESVSLVAQHPRRWPIRRLEIDTVYSNLDERHCLHIKNNNIESSCKHLETRRVDLMS